MREGRNEFLPSLERLRPYRDITALAFACLLTLSLSACHESPGETGITKAPRNLILIVLDTLRADHVSVIGDKAQTPHIDNLARQGLLFRRAYSHIPVTGPSHASMFTGLLPIQHGVEKNTDILSGSFETLAESLKKRGYSSYAVVSLGVLKARFGFAQGFDVWEDNFDRQWFLRAEEVVEKVGKVLPEKAPDTPVFLFAHFSDPHEPYSPPGLKYPEFSLLADGHVLGKCRADGMGCEVSIDLSGGDREVHLRSDAPLPRELGFRQLEVRGTGAKISLGEGWERVRGSAPGRMNQCRLPASLLIKGPKETVVRLSFFASEILDLEDSLLRYAKEVEYADGQIGRLLHMLKVRGYLKNSLVVFTADHGEGLGQHGLLGHKRQVYDSLIRVPLIMVAHGLIPPGKICEQAVCHIDMNASIRQILGLEEVPSSPGVSVVEKLLAGQAIPEKPEISMTFTSSGGVDLRSAVFRHFKLIRNLHSGGEEFYDLRRDPGELDDIFLSNRLLALSSEEKKALRVLGSALDSLAEIEKSGRYRSADTAALDAEDLARLEALGYTQ